MPSHHTMTRQPFVAGQFYEGHAEVLRMSVEKALAEASASCAKPASPSVLTMLPHAGHVYCADVIAATLARVLLPETLILLCPNHTGQGEKLAIWPEGAWLTPLGSVPVAQEICAELLQGEGAFKADTKAHRREHSLEVLLPFLQVCVPHLRIVPLCAGNLNLAELQRAGKVLAELLRSLKMRGQEAALILSSDMNHFADHESTCRLDAMALQHMLEMNPEGLAHVVIENNISMCGLIPALLSLYACKELGVTQMELVKHSTSGLQNGDWQRVVGYAGLRANENILPNGDKEA